MLLGATWLYLQGAVRCQEKVHALAVPSISPLGGDVWPSTFAAARWGGLCSTLPTIGISSGWENSVVLFTLPSGQLASFIEELCFSGKQFAGFTALRV